jgi:methionyl-tRNA formyltransferase
VKYLYVSRQFNRSGYYILKALLEAGIMPFGVLLPTLNSIPELDDPGERKKYIDDFDAKRVEQGHPDVRFMESIKLLAKSYGVTVFERRTLKDEASKDWVESLALDMIVLGGGWPELIPVEIIRLPKVGLLNTHPSLLPEFRGTDIHRWQVLFGVESSGATIHYIDETFDTGDIVGQKAVAITDTDTPQALFEKTAKVSGELMVEVMHKHEAAYPNKIEGTPQSSRKDKSKYYSRWKWERPSFMQIDWQQSAIDIARKVLASTQEDYKYNGVFAYYKGQKWIFRRAVKANVDEHSAEPGTILSVDDNGLLVACSTGALLVQQLQKGTELGYPEQENKEKAVSGAGAEIVESNVFSLDTKFE